MLNLINISEGVNQENYKNKVFPKPLNLVLSRMMSIGELFNETIQDSEGQLKNDMEMFHQQFHTLFKSINEYQEKLKKQ